MTVEKISLDGLHDKVEQRYRSAMLFCLPLFTGLALMFLEVIFEVVFFSGLVFGFLAIGVLIAAVPVTRYHKAKSAFERKKKLDRLATLASAFEAEN